MEQEENFAIRRLKEKPLFQINH